jgi:hypothetical protein
MGNETHDGLTSNDWGMMILSHLATSYNAFFDRTAFRRAMIKIAGLAVAAVEWCDTVKPIARGSAGSKSAKY